MGIENCFIIKTRLKWIYRCLLYTSENEVIADDSHELVKELYDLWENLNQPRLIETWHDAMQIREDALGLFNLGLIDLQTRAQVERLFWSVARDVYDMAVNTKHSPDELKKIRCV